jgi:hypothetical protein
MTVAHSITSSARASSVSGISRPSEVRKHFHPFWTNLNGDIADAGQVTSRPAETIDKPELNWVNANIEHDGNTSRRGLCSRSGRTADR